VGCERAAVVANGAAGQVALFFCGLVSESDARDGTAPYRRICAPLDEDSAGPPVSGRDDPTPFLKQRCDNQGQTV
jgi:hypothetical protein